MSKGQQREENRTSESINMLNPVKSERTTACCFHITAPNVYILPPRYIRCRVVLKEYRECISFSFNK